MTTKAPKTKAKSTEKKGKSSGRSEPRKTAKAAKAGRANASRRNGETKPRLRPGELDGLVLGFMRKNEKELPMSPTTIAKGMTPRRSSGAVGNCLERLAKAKQARLAKKAPREYDLKGVATR